MGSGWNKNISGISVAYYNVRNWNAAKKFYGETLGLPVSFGNEEMGWLEFGVPGQPTLAINKWAGPDPMPPTVGGATVTLNTGNLDGCIADLKIKGVKCDDVQEIPGMVRILTIVDPEGNRVQIAHSLVARS
jgi:predicted enzyme related to lactoylglutathione lyase